MGVVQLGKRRNSSSEPERRWDEARLRAKMTVVTVASEALVEMLEATLVAAKLVGRLSEQPTPASLAGIWSILYLRSFKRRWSDSAAFLKALRDCSP